MRNVCVPILTTSLRSVTALIKIQARATTSGHTQSTDSGSAEVLTPRSSSKIGSSFESVDGVGSHSHGRSGADIVAGSSIIPSIERSSDSSSDDNQATTATVRRKASHDTKGKTVIREGRGPSIIDGGLANMRISSPGSGLVMSGMAAEINAVASSSGSNPKLLKPGYPNKEDNSSSRPFSRRRSSSRTIITPHDVQDEDPPQDRFHEPNFQQAFGDAKRLMSEIASVLGSSSLLIDPDSTVQRLHREAGDLGRFQCVSSRTVGFVGDSGVGMLYHPES
jgi:hypothetical protein